MTCSIIPDQIEGFSSRGFFFLLPGTQLSIDLFSLIASRKRDDTNLSFLKFFNVCKELGKRKTNTQNKTKKDTAKISYLKDEKGEAYLQLLTAPFYIELLKLLSGSAVIKRD